jgi:two-component system chemotaxis response regulator CheY
MQALVIDDARVMRLLLRGTLQQLGFAVSEAGNGREGLDRLAQGNRPDVVFVDCYMPEMDGFAFLQGVRANPLLTGLPVIMVTGENDGDTARRALSEGASACIVKPFTPDIIRDQLQSLGVACAGP